MKKRVIVCDYNNPLNFTFPNSGLGSAENKFWEIARVFSNFEDFEVTVTGPLWRLKYLPNASHFKKRLDQTTVDEFLKKYGQFDYLFAGSEYFDKTEYIATFFKVADKLISYQDHIHKYNNICFDKKRIFLFCYSDEMMNKYKAQSPIKSLLFNSSINGDAYFTQQPKDYLVWIGRIDEDKAPHYAILAANILKYLYTF